MDSAHVFLIVASIIVVVTLATFFWVMLRKSEYHEAVGAATFLALRDLKERFEKSPPR